MLIPLTKNKYATIDKQSYKIIKNYRWRVHTRGTGKQYAQTGSRHSKIIFMHRLLLKANKQQKVDHIDGNGLNNNINNLRFATGQQNMWNQRPQRRRKTSKYKGVSYHKHSGKWRAYIKKNRKVSCLGYFKKETLAAIAYNKAAKKLFGEFAWLNKIHQPARLLPPELGKHSGHISCPSRLV